LPHGSGTLPGHRLGRIALFLAVLGVVVLAAGCSGERVVFAGSGGGSGDGVRGVRPIDVVDLGLSQLTNLTGQRIRLRSVTLVTPPRGVHVRSVTSYYQPHSNDLALGLGDYLRYCRRTDHPFPVTAAVARPHTYSRWLVVIALTIARPGRYHLGRAKISYTADGKDGWQYENLSTTLFGVPTPPGAKPRLGGCP